MSFGVKTYDHFHETRVGPHNFTWNFFQVMCIFLNSKLYYQLQSYLLSFFIFSLNTFCVFQSSLLKFSNIECWLRKQNKINYFFRRILLWTEASKIKNNVMPFPFLWMLESDMTIICFEEDSSVPGSLDKKGRGRFHLSCIFCCIKGSTFFNPVV
jgi:hypothetical protein